MAVRASFSFTGTLIIPRETSKRTFCRSIEKPDTKTGKTRKMLAMSFGIKSSDNNAAFVEAFGVESDKIFTMDINNERCEIDWDERFNEDVVNKVASYRKYRVNLGKEYGGSREFISEYDMINFLESHLRDYEGKVLVRGQFVREWYAKKNTYMDKFHIQSVYAVKEESKSCLELTMDIFYNRDCIDKDEFSKKKKIYLNGYIEQYINKDEGMKMIPMQFVISAAKFDMENNEMHKRLWEYRMNYVDIKNKTYVHIPWQIVLVQGAEETEFDESMLTDAQRQQVELGIRSVEDFKPRERIFGENIKEYRLRDPQLTGGYEDGLADTEEGENEFAERVYIPPRIETFTGETASADVSEPIEDFDDDDDLF